MHQGTQSQFKCSISWAAKSVLMNVGYRLANARLARSRSGFPALYLHKAAQLLQVCVCLLYSNAREVWQEVAASHDAHLQTTVQVCFVQKQVRVQHWATLLATSPLPAAQVRWHSTTARPGVCATSLSTNVSASVAREGENRWTPCV